MGMRDHIPGVRKRRIGDSGRASEKRVAKSLGAKLRPASGAVEGFKGDMGLDDWLMEAKSTVHDSITIEYKWLGKIASEAMQERGKSPAVTISFVDNTGRAVNFGDWVMVRKRDWERLVEGEE